MFLILYLYYLDGALACSGWSYDYGTTGNPDYGLLNNPNKTRLKGSKTSGWQPSAEMQQAWDDWLTDYKAKINGTDYVDPDSEIGKALEKERETIGGWPRDWKGLGVGIGGVPPPPWAYVKMHIGKPTICTLPPLKGNCSEKIKRWGYNPYANDCITFIYSGCGGNWNNFKSHVECVSRCMDEPKPDCDEESVLQVDENIWV